MTTRAASLVIACITLIGCATPDPVPPGAAEPSSGVPIVVCGRIDPIACETAIGLARAAAGPEEDVGTFPVVVDDLCPPPSVCDRKYAFDSLVTFVTAGQDTTGWYAYEVTGLEPDTPTHATRWIDQFPPHIVSLVTTSLP